MSSGFELYPRWLPLESAKDYYLYHEHNLKVKSVE